MQLAGSGQAGLNARVIRARKVESDQPCSRAFICRRLLTRSPVSAESQGRAGERDDRRPTITTLVQLARDFSPRVETHGDRTVTLDISGLGSLIGEPRSIGEELRRTAADAGLRVHIAVAATSTAAILLAHARAGLTVVPRGEEAASACAAAARATDAAGLRASGFGLWHLPQPSSLKPDAAQSLDRIAATHALGSAHARRSGGASVQPSCPPVSVRPALRWQRWARGEEMRPLVPAGVAEQFEAVARSRVAHRRARAVVVRAGAAARAVVRAARARRSRRGRAARHVDAGDDARACTSASVELPAPMRDARVLRTLALLDLESNPPPAAIDRVTVGVDVTEGRVLQFGLFARALPTDKLATLLARLGALMGSDRVGAPSLVDTYRPGAFAMAKFDPPRNFTNPQSPIPNPDRQASAPSSVLRRFRSSDSRARHRSNRGARSASRPIAAGSPAAASSAAKARGARRATGGRQRHGTATSGTWR